MCIHQWAQPELEYIEDDQPNIKLYCWKIECVLCGCWHTVAHLLETDSKEE